MLDSISGPFQKTPPLLQFPLKVIQTLETNLMLNLGIYHNLANWLNLGTQDPGGFLQTCPDGFIHRDTLLFPL